MAISLVAHRALHVGRDGLLVLEHVPQRRAAVPNLPVDVVFLRPPSRVDLLRRLSRRNPELSHLNLPRLEFVRRKLQRLL